MAKKNRDEPEATEDYDFIPPEFDEDAFIHKEMVSFHTTTVLFLAGIVAAIASWAAFGAVNGDKTGWLIGIIIVAITFAALRTLFKVLKIDISHWARREWLGTGFLLFFTWLSFFIMFINPPISDFADPDVDVFVGPSAAVEGQDVVMDFFFTDNGKVADHGVTIDGQEVALEHLGGPHYRYVMKAPAADTYTWSATATDKKGHTTEANGTVEVGNNVLRITNPGTITRTDELFVLVPDSLNVYAVYAEVHGGDRVYLTFNEDAGGYLATSNFLGWNNGTNTFDIVVEEKNRFHGETMVPGGILRSVNETAQVTDPGESAKSIPKKANPTRAPVRNVPGLELPLLAAGLVGAAFLARRK